MSTPSAIRAATHRDIPAIFDLLVLLHTETPHAPLDHACLRDGIDECLTQGIVMLALSPDGEPVGTVGLCIDRPWFSRENWLCDRWMFVHPAHRRTQHAQSLLQACVVVAKKNKLPLHMAVTGHGPRIAGKIRLFQRVLGAPTGALWTVT